MDKGLFVSDKGFSMTDKGLSKPDNGLFATEKGLSKPPNVVKKRQIASGPPQRGGNHSARCWPVPPAYAGYDAHKPFQPQRGCIMGAFGFNPFRVVKWVMVVDPG